METVNARFVWNGPEDNRMYLVMESMPLWEAYDVDGSLFILYALDEHEERTDTIVGVEMLDFLDYACWERVPETPVRWRIPGWEPLSLVDLLMREQRALREQYAVARTT